MTFGDFIVSKQVGFQAFFMLRLWDSSENRMNISIRILRQYRLWKWALVFFVAFCQLSFNRIAYAASYYINIDAAIKQRTALIIGNANYDKYPLKNPLHDSMDMARKLEKIGFEVMLAQNQTKRDMERVIMYFQQRIDKKGGIALFYYAGHAMQVSGKNLLAPIGINIDIGDIARQSISLNEIQELMESSRAELNVLILDACRDNPFEDGGVKIAENSSRSLSRGILLDAKNMGKAQKPPAIGTLIAFSTSPDRKAYDGIGRNGTYTKYLLKYIDAPSIPISEIFRRVRTEVVRETSGKQVPWERLGLLKDAYFISPKIEIEHWNNALKENTVEALMGYLEKYPNGRFSHLVDERISLIEEKKALKEEKKRKAGRQLFGTF